MNTLNTKQAAAFLHIHPITLLRKIHAGEIPATKIGKAWVLIDVDLAQHVRSQYFQQAAQGDNKEISICHSTNVQTRPIGGLKSQSQAVKRYKDRLELPTNSRQRNTKRS